MLLCFCINRLARGSILALSSFTAGVGSEMQRSKPKSQITNQEFSNGLYLYDPYDVDDFESGIVQDMSMSHLVSLVYLFSSLLITRLIPISYLHRTIKI